VDMRYSNGFAIGWRGDRRPSAVRPASMASQQKGDPGLDG
jgi:hypothetical protein